MPLSSWVEFAACKGKPVVWFFPVQGGPWARAKLVCAACPVRERCLEYALTEHIQFGIWGGLSERQRRRLRRRSGVAPSSYAAE